MLPVIYDCEESYIFDFWELEVLALPTSDSDETEEPADEIGVYAGDGYEFALSDYSGFDASSELCCLIISCLGLVSYDSSTSSS